MYRKKMVIVLVIGMFIGAGLIPNMLTINVKADITTGLVGYWCFDEGSGNIAKDSAGDNDGILTNMNIASCWDVGKSNTGLNFDGEDDYVNCGNNPSLDFGTNDFSIVAWIKADSFGGYNRIVTNNAEVSAGEGYILSTRRYGTNTKLVAYIGTGLVDITGSTILETNKWYQVAVVRNDDSGFLFVNGELDGSTSGL